MFAVAPLVGRLAQRVDLRAMMTVGFLIMAISVWMTANLTAQSSFAELALPLGLRGAGTMCAMIPVNQVALGTLPASMLKNAAGLYNLMRNLGGAIGLAVINTLAQDRSYLHRVQLGEEVNWARTGTMQTLDSITHALEGHIAGDPDLAALRRIYGIVQREALVMTYNDILVAMAVLFVVVAPMAFLVARPRTAGGGGGISPMTRQASLGKRPPGNQRFAKVRRPDPGFQACARGDRHGMPVGPSGVASPS
ncbi:MAG: hypothetical protein ACJ8AI_28905 [Rhodopila sp.]